MATLDVVVVTEHLIVLPGHKTKTNHVREGLISIVMGGDSKGTYRKGEPFLAERQQAKSDGSLPATRESLPAAKQSALNTDKRAVKKPELKTEKNNAYNAVDSIVTSGSEPNRAQRKNELQQKTANIMERFDLHNIAGVICIDDMTDDDSDISSTLSGFVEVTSRRAIKEQKDRQREEEEKKRRVEEKAEYARQKANQTGDGKFSKKNQSSKPPRFAKQHPAVAPSQPHSPPKPVGNLGKLAAEIVQGPPSTGASSKCFKYQLHKEEQSPITVERPMSPAPAPIFNAWDRHTDSYTCQAAHCGYSCDCECSRPISSWQWKAFIFKSLTKGECDYPTYQCIKPGSC